MKSQLLKKLISERELARKLMVLTADLEADARNELTMLRDRLGDFANSPLGGAAVAAIENASANGEAALASVGA